MTRQLQVLFLVALAGVLAALGALAYGVGGVWALVAYVVVAAAVVLVGGAWARSVAAGRAREAQGSTCTCCTSTVHDPVQVL